jgi:hypothetical protein
VKQPNKRYDAPLWDPRDFDKRGLTLRQPPRGYCIAFVLAPVVLGILAWVVW